MIIEQVMSLGEAKIDLEDLKWETSLYATARFKPTDRLAVIAGGQVVDWETDTQGVNWQGPKLLL